MKIATTLFLGLLFFTFSAADLRAQYKKLTVILLRHAEKDLSEGADTANPELSAAGKERAARLVKLMRKHRIDAIYSTDFIRTRATVAPIARKNRSMVLMYDPRNLTQMRDLILAGKLRTILVVGHNTTTPALVNMLVGEERYKKLDETEYDKIFVVKIRKYKRKPNRVKEKVVVY